MWTFLKGAYFEMARIEEKSLKDNKLQQDQLVSYLNYLKQMFFE